VGDVAWDLRQHEGREHEWRIRLWEEGGAVVAWSWLRVPSGTLDFDVRADRPELLDKVLAEPDAQTTFAFADDEELRAALARHGFRRPGEAMHFHVRDLVDPLPAPLRLPEGFRYRTVGDADLAERVAIHRDVWAPSRVTEASYATVRQTWPYRGSLDCVIEAPDGIFAAYCLVWPDDENAVGELEPVGVREQFRRRGFGAAVCTYALDRLHEEGGKQAVVYSATEPATALYRTLGFERHGTMVGYSR
jgi:ribosomal protein S18 acetylase RimI-like enzyme